MKNAFFAPGKQQTLILWLLKGRKQFQAIKKKIKHWNIEEKVLKGDKSGVGVGVEKKTGIPSNVQIVAIFHQDEILINTFFINPDNYNNGRLIPVKSLELQRFPSFVILTRREASPAFSDDVMFSAQKIVTSLQRRKNILRSLWNVLVCFICLALRVLTSTKYKEKLFSQACYVNTWKIFWIFRF